MIFGRKVVWKCRCACRPARPLLPFDQPHGITINYHETAPADRPACAIRSGTVVLTVRGYSIHGWAEPPDAIWWRM